MKLRRILHPSDFSPPSRAAFARALDLAKDNKAGLWIVHVVATVPPLFGQGYVSPRAFGRIDRSIRAAGQESLDALVARARKAGIHAQGLLLRGAPHAGIVRAARSKRADLIVMGTHGRSGLAKLFVGSVAERVVASAPCPVLAVRSGRTR